MTTLETIQAYARENRERFPGLTVSLSALDAFVGLDGIKERVAETVQYVLSSEMSARTKRVSPVMTRAMNRRVGKNKRKAKNHRWSHSKSKRRHTNKTPDKHQQRIHREIEEFSRVLLNSMATDDVEEDTDFELDEEDCRPAYARNINLNTLLMGDPGTGKTSLAHTLHAIWAALGLVRKDRFRVVTRGDLVGKYQGHSTAKIQDILCEMQNGVVFIDEAYSLVNDSKDSFGSEVMAEIVEAMTNTNQGRVTFIMAGYEHSIRKSILEHNEGLERRFGTVFKIPKPTTIDLVLILLRMVRREKWVCTIESDAIIAAFERVRGSFRFAGGDMELLFQNIQRSHIKRLWPEGMTKKITMQDLRSGIAGFKSSTDRRVCEVPVHMFT